MNLSESYFDNVKVEVEKLLCEAEVKGIAAEFVGRQFVVSYFKGGDVFDRTFTIKPPAERDRSIWFNQVIPQMNELVYMLEEFAKELNHRFASEYVKLLRQLHSAVETKELVAV